LDTPLMHQTLRTILAPLRQSNGILLACTHYPAIRHLIQPLVPNSEILDPSVMTARELVGLKTTQRRNGPSDIFFTTGDALRSRQAAYSAFGIKIDRFIRIELEPPGSQAQELTTKASTKNQH